MKKIIFLFLILLVVISTYKTNNKELIIPNTSIRLRIIPNSNNYEDVYIKQQVKKYLENNLYKELQNINNINEARQIINNNIPILNDNIDNIFTINNYKEKYNINFGYNYFPKKIYRGKNYKEGLYESLVITIGKGEGDNWWCALFPNFCLLDLDEEQEYKSYIYELIKDIL